MSKERLFTLCALLLSILFFPSLARSGTAVPEVPLPARYSPVLDYLLAQAGPDPEGDFNPARVEKILEFVLAAPSGPLFYAERDRGATSAFYAFDLQARLDRLLKYAYNPRIPGHVFAPSSLRRVRWTGQEEAGRLRLWEKLSSLDRPIILRGTEFEEITPNLATGTYFEYDVYRTLILFRYQGRPVLIAITRQMDRSAVGKKGAVLGSDADWNYLYSGEKGVARSGLGWVDSYMYDSFSISIYCETAGESPRLRAGVFKWLNAGWAGVNLVNRRHIHDGLVRFAGDLRSVIENPALPAPEELEKIFSRLAGLPASELERLLRRHLSKLAKEYEGDPALRRGKMEDMLRSESYLKKMGREEIEAVLSLELMKGILGGDGDPELMRLLR